ncbi:MAG TPA: class D beta-lactamase [Usitatibacter sp.]|jgi:beta-lactamase class D|nr:class D beta-lactamase [Usitatibacter sp.]
MDRLSTSLVALFAGFSPGAAPTVERTGWQAAFAAQGVKGTFVLYRPALDRFDVLDAERARTRYLPASTFKVANALIALDAGTLRDQHEAFRWDGKPKMRRAWERDHALDSGMRESVVWMFQEIARRTGKARMKQGLDRLGYGNGDIGGGIDLFWLQGSLRISAMEQADFLRRLREGRLAASARSTRLVRNALVVERTNRYTLYGKTGTTGALREGIAWWVGWVEQDGAPTAYFAMNYTAAARTPYAARFAIAREVLRGERLLP